MSNSSFFPWLTHWKDWCWSWNSSTLATSCEKLTHWKRPWCWEGLGAGGEGGDRGWDGWMASLTRWAWVWVNSRSWWWTGRPGVLWFMGSQRVRHDWETELNWTKLNPWQGFPCSSDGEESACNARNPGSIPGLGRSPGGGLCKPLQWSYLETPMDWGAWQAAVHGVTKSWTWLSTVQHNTWQPKFHFLILWMWLFQCINGIINICPPVTGLFYLA